MTQKETLTTLILAARNRGITKQAVLDEMNWHRVDFEKISSGQKPFSVNDFFSLCNFIKVHPTQIIAQTITNYEYNSGRTVAFKATPEYRQEIRAEG